MISFDRLLSAFSTWHRPASHVAERRLFTRHPGQQAKRLWSFAILARDGAIPEMAPYLATDDEPLESLPSVPVARHQIFDSAAQPHKRLR
jgi:hypothetical protein